MDEDDNYCIECGSERLVYLATYANGEEWKCADCENLMMFAEREDD